MRRLALLSLVLAAACSATEDAGDDPWGDGKGDGWSSQRDIDVVLTAPYCDVCTADDKAFLQERSQINPKVIALIDAAETSIDIANYTFSVKSIEAAIVRAKLRGVTVRVAMDKGQENGDTVATRLRTAGVDVKFVA